MCAQALDIPENGHVALVNTPYTFVDGYLCPSQVSIGELQLMRLLRSRQNRVSLINMRSREKHWWKEKRAGCDGSVTLRTKLLGRSPEFFATALAGLEEQPDQVWITCSFSCDAEVVSTLVGICAEVCPGAKVVIGGKAVAVSPERFEHLGAELWTDRIDEADLCRPVDSVL